MNNDVEVARDLQEAQEKFCAQHKTKGEYCITCLDERNNPVKWVISNMAVVREYVPPITTSS